MNDTIASKTNKLGVSEKGTSPDSDFLRLTELYFRKSSMFGAT